MEAYFNNIQVSLYNQGKKVKAGHTSSLQNVFLKIN
jgi:hypothetical protein